MLLAVVVTAAAESAIGLLLLLHLQRGLGLDVGPIALVFLPGGIVMSVLPPYLHRFVLRSRPRPGARGGVGVQCGVRGEPRRGRRTRT